MAVLERFPDGVIPPTSAPPAFHSDLYERSTHLYTYTNYVQAHVMPSCCPMLMIESILL